MSGLESRLLIITSADAGFLGPGHSTTNFDVTLEDSSADLRSRIKGVSVDSVQFINRVPNVREKRNSFKLIRNFSSSTSDHITEHAVPEGFYSLDQLVATLNGLVGDEVEFTVNVGTGMDGGDRLGIQSVDGLLYGLTLQCQPRDNLGYQLGLQQVDTVLSKLRPEDESIVDKSPPLEFMANLHGEYALQLQSTHIAGSRFSLNGTGAQIPCILTIPLTTEYGTVQSTDGHTAMGTPSVIYGAQDPHDIHTIDLSLRYLDGEIVDLGHTNLHVTLRLWVINK